MAIGHIRSELGRHVPFTLFGAVCGMLIMAAFIATEVPAHLTETLFWTFHPLHVLFSALATTSMFCLQDCRNRWLAVAVGYGGAVGIATLSDCLIPFVGEWMLGLPNRGVRLGFIEKWWLVNPMAFMGIGIALRRPRTRFPHAVHVLLSTWASLFHMTMALHRQPGAGTLLVMALFLFLSVWIPCCTSDIVFPLWAANFAGKRLRRCSVNK